MATGVGNGTQSTMVVDESVLLTDLVQVSHTVSSTFSVHEHASVDGGDGMQYPDARPRRKVRRGGAPVPP